MDPVTHAASGAVAMLALPHRPKTAWAWPLAALACASPDIDLAFIHTPLEFLELHRGITHSLAAAPVLGLLLAILFRPLWNRKIEGHWNFGAVWLFCILMLLLHMWLDVVTTYGTMIFLPFSHYRVRLNSLFIVDLLVTVPLLWALWRWRKSPKLMLATLCWIFLYPASGIGFNAWHTIQWTERASNMEAGLSRLVVLPDVFMPLFWRVVYEDGKGVVHDQSINFFGDSREPERLYKAVPATLTQTLKDSSTDGEVFMDFAVLPVIRPLPDKFLPENQPPENGFHLIHDLRFGSGLAFMRRLLALRPNADMPFLLMAQTGDDFEKIKQIRLRFSDSGRDSMWHEPERMPKPTFWQWLVGIR